MSETVTFDILLIPDGGGGYIAEVPALNERLIAWGEDEVDALLMIEQELEAFLGRAKSQGQGVPIQAYEVRKRKN